MKKVLCSIIIVFGIFILAGCGKEELVNRYFVTFETNGGTAVKQQVIIEGNKATIPAEPSKSGYAFAGWYLNEELYDFNTPVTGNINLIATWNEIIYMCDNTCNEGYTLDKDCNCIKEANTKTPNTTRTIRTTIKAKKSILSLSENNITLVIGDKTYIDAYSNEQISWKSSNTSIAEVNNGFIKGVKSGFTTVIASTKDNNAIINVRVITKDREKLEAFASIMTPKIIRSVGTSLLYSFDGCSIENTANITNIAGLEIQSGIVIRLDDKIDGTLVSSYTISCGNEKENITVEHIVNNI